MGGVQKVELPNVLNTWGAMGFWDANGNTIWEKEWTLDLALRVKQEIESDVSMDKVIVTMTRSTDIPLPDPNRAIFARSMDADIFLSIHFNATRLPFQPHSMRVYVREEGPSQLNYDFDYKFGYSLLKSTYYEYRKFFVQKYGNGYFDVLPSGLDSFRSPGEHSIHTSRHVFLSDKLLGYTSPPISVSPEGIFSGDVDSAVVNTVDVTSALYEVNYIRNTTFFEHWLANTDLRDDVAKGISRAIKINLNL